VLWLRRDGGCAYARAVSARTGWLLAILILGATLFGVALWAFPPHQPQPVEPIAVTDVVAPRPKTVMDMRSLFDALVFVKPQFGQRATGQHSAGADLMAQWASVHMGWSDVATERDETNYGLATRDIDAERGKRVCFSGSIIEIKVDRSTPAPSFEGLMQSDAGNVFSFGAAGAVGSIVAGSYARLCAVVLDIFAYESAAHVERKAVDVVGMFDVPENHPGTAQPGAPPPRTVVLVAPKASSSPCEEPFVTTPDGKLSIKPGCDRK
jgi:hypothetical protein